MSALIGLWVVYSIMYRVALGVVTDFNKIKRIRDLGLGLKFFGILWCLYTLVVIIAIINKLQIISL